VKPVVNMAREVSSLNSRLVLMLLLMRRSPKSAASAWTATSHMPCCLAGTSVPAWSAQPLSRMGTVHALCAVSLSNGLFRSSLELCADMTACSTAQGRETIVQRRDFRL